MITLDSIKGLIRDKKELALSEEVLGPDLFTCVSRLLNTKVSDLRLCNCLLSESDESHVRLTAQMPSIFGFNNITTDFSLFERASPRTGGVRNCVFGIEMPAAATVDSYLAQYAAEPDHDSPAGSTAVTTMLARYFRTIAFADRVMVFSSIDYTQPENADAFYPEVYRTHIPASQVKAGMNFLAKIAYQEAASIFADVFETDSRFQALTQTESPNQPVVVVPVEQGVSVIVDKDVGIELELGPISVSLDVIRMSLPVVPIEGSQPQTGFIGSLKIAEGRLKITAEFCPYYNDFSVSFWDFPSLKGMMGLLGKGAQDAYFPEPLSSLLSVKLSRAGMALNLTKKTVRGISLSLRTDEAIPLIENIIRFAPELEIGIDYPLDEQRRAIQGEIRGIWQLGETQFRTALYYPSFNFCAGMAEGQNLDAGAVLKYMLSGIDLAAPHLTFTGMEVYGNFLSKSFSAEIALSKDSKWEFSIAGRQFGIQIKKMLMAYDNQLVSYAMDASLVLAGVEVLLSAQYKKTLTQPSAGEAAVAAGGWKFAGSTDEGQKIKISEVLKWVVEQFGDTPQLPEAIEGFTVDKLKLSFETESQDFFFTCEGEVILPGQNSPIQGIVTIDIKHQDNSYSKRFGGSLIIEGMEFDLVFESASEAMGGGSRMFLATYHGDVKISIDKLLRQAFTEPITTGVELTLKDALFGYRGDENGPKYLFGLKIGIDIGLAKLPVVGPALPPDLQVGIEDLQILAATRAFRLQEVTDLNGVMPAGVTKLPSGKPDGGDTALQKGLNFSAKLKLGGTDKFLMLPAADTGASTPPPSNTTVSPAAAAAPARKWFDIQKSLGPLRLERLGVEYKERRLGILFDAGMDLLAVRLDLLGLSIGLPLSNPRPEDLVFGLDGLELSVKQKPLEISGALLRVYPTAQDISLQYDGRVLVRAEVFSLAALGSYAVIRDQPSLFIFAVLNKELGGPAFFFVTGLAFGFGVNRLLKLPAIAEVQNFPLVKGATDPEYFGSDATPRTALQKLQEYIPPSVGDYWLAAGVKFNSFGMIDSFAMLSVSFGTQFQIAILGLSRISVPKQLPGAAPVDPVACAELAIKVTFTLSTGLLAAEARLTENSFVFSKECKLRGGFALYCWFGPEHAGDFVVTLGGYHPKFVPPAHYPAVPRLGMDWQVGQNLALSGELYFALTPSCLMAGGKLSAVYQAGPLRAWFYAGADFLINWQPFSYDIAMGVRIGVSYVLSAVDTNQSLTIEIGAQLHLWGPPFGGLATVTLSIISFDISFGEPQQPALEKAEWNEFQQSFLPQAEETGADPLLCTIRITSGLIKTQEVTKNGKKSTRSVVNAHEFSFTTESVVPATNVLLNNKPVEAVGLAPRPVGIRPMDIKALTSVHAVSFETTEQPENESAPSLAPNLITKSVPDALWSNSGLTRLDHPGAEMIEAVPNGVRVGVRNREPSHGLAPIELEKFKYERIPKDIAWEEWQPPVPIPAPGDKTLASTIWNNLTVDAARKVILTALGKENTQIDLRNLAAASAEIFQSEPDMARLGEPFKQPLYAG
jgi:hypothetical protein